MPTCTHATYHVRRVTAFSGPSLGPNECRAAHGGQTEHQECADCGARRSANFNGRHVEFGHWEGSTAERRAGYDAARAAYDDALAAAQPRTLHHRHQGHAVQVSVVFDDVSGRFQLEVRGPLPHPTSLQVCAAWPGLTRVCSTLDTLRTAWISSHDAI